MFNALPRITDNIRLLQSVILYIKTFNSQIRIKCTPVGQIRHYKEEKLSNHHRLLTNDEKYITIPLLLRRYAVIRLANDSTV